MQVINLVISVISISAAIWIISRCLEKLKWWELFLLIILNSLGSQGTRYIASLF